MKKNIPSHCGNVLLVFAFTISVLSTHAQKTNAVQERKTLDSLLANDHLDTLTGFPVTLYSRGYNVRAKAIQSLVQSCIQYYKILFPGDKYSVQLEILNKQDWESLPFPQPYGLPHFTDINQSIIVSADKNALNKLNNQADQNTDDSIISGFDYVALHELGHYFFFSIHHIDKDHFLNETMASYFLICYLKNKKLSLDLGKENASYLPKYKTVEDFNKLYIGVGPQNYDWYQRRFIELGFSIYPGSENKLILSVLENYSPGGKNIDALDLFKNLLPEPTTTWLKNMK